MAVLDQFKLDGKVAIVTGAGRGLGQAIAFGLAEAGADIAAVDVLDQAETKAGRRNADGAAPRSRPTCRRANASRRSSTPRWRRWATLTFFSTTPASSVARR